MLATTLSVLAGFNVNIPTYQCDSRLLGIQTALPVVVYAAAGAILLVRTWAIVGPRLKLPTAALLMNDCDKVGTQCLHIGRIECATRCTYWDRDLDSNDSR